jgi:carboxypeptidase Taq
MNTTPWDTLQSRTRELQTLTSLMGVLHWEQQVTMPSGGNTVRGEQLALLATLRHARLSDPALGDLIAQAAESDMALHRAAARNLARDHKRAAKLPASLVDRTSRATTAAFPAWAKAKQDNDWASFEPHLQRVVDLTQESVAILAEPGQDPYDVLLEAHDPGSTAANLDPMFERLEQGTKAFLAKLDGRPHPATLQGPFPVAGQKRLHAQIASAIGFDLSERGRLDEAEHPFSAGFHPHDVRITTHYYENDLLSGLGGTVHEAGHGMYEQGLPTELWGTGAGDAASYGLHESQSRFWENFIGRSLPFSNWLAPQARELLGLDMTGAQIFQAANRVEPSLIRVFADEVTYNLHVVLRYRLERQLFSGALAVRDLPQAWDGAMQSALGLTPPTVADGALQDVHWCSGAFGYFPSYTLGNLYAASLGVALEAAMPDLWDRVEAGDFAPILAWLRTHVHRHGHLMDAPEIVEAACGGPRDMVADLLAHFERRQGPVYSL